MLKKILALSLAVLMIVCMFTGCKQDEVKDPTEPPVTESTKPGDTTDNPGDTTKPTEPVEKPTDPVTPPLPGEELEDHGDFFIMEGKFGAAAFTDENVVVKFIDLGKDEAGAWINFTIEDSLKRDMSLMFSNGAYVNGCLVWPDAYFDEESQQYRIVITGADLGIYGIRDIRTFVANDVDVMDNATGEICKVINLDAKSTAKTKDEPKEGTEVMSVKDVTVTQYYTEYGFSVKEPLFVIKNNAKDVYAIRMTKLVINGENKSFDSSVAQQSTIKNTSAILPFKAMVQFGLGIDLTGVDKVVCDFDIYNVNTGISVKSIKDVEIKL